MNGATWDNYSELVGRFYQEELRNLEKSQVYPRRHECREAWVSLLTKAYNRAMKRAKKELNITDKELN